MKSLKHACIYPLIVSILSFLVACSLVDTEQPAIPCPIEDNSYCDFVRELEPLIVAQDVEAILEKVDLHCCSGDFQYPDAPSDPDFDPEEECVRSGVLLGEGSCIPVSDFGDRWAEDAPFTVNYILRPEDSPFESASIRDGPALIVSTGDEDWDLAFATKKESDKWIVTRIIGIRKDVLSRFPADSLIPWPPGSPTLIAPPYVTPKG